MVFLLITSSFTTLFPSILPTPHTGSNIITQHLPLFPSSHLPISASFLPFLLHQHHIQHTSSSLALHSVNTLSSSYTSSYFLLTSALIYCDIVVVILLFLLFQLQLIIIIFIIFLLVLLLPLRIIILRLDREH